MKKNEKVFTFLVAPGSTSRIKQFSIPKRAVYGGLLLLIVFFAAGFYAVTRVAQTEALNLRYAAIKAENAKLKQSNDAYETSYARLKGQISYVEDMSKELSRQAKMEHRSDIDQQVGMGGPETVAALDRAANHLEREVRQLNDKYRSDLLRLSSVPGTLPVKGYITDGFGLRRNPFNGEGRETHEGVDIAVEFGTPVQATADGFVIHAGPYSGYGNLVVVYHTNGITTRYGHLSRITVEAGQRVKRGDQVGHAGSTGRSTGPHVHYEIRENDQPVDPMKYVGQAQP
ncbi:MAG TPA: M23 family metallopeptidase [Blastocatellia bacterium]|nr:M23 family metallopeptidase [Blastocatellia bacterium]